MEENDKAEKAKAEKAKTIKEKEASPAKVEKEEVMDVDSGKIFLWLNICMQVRRVCSSNNLKYLVHADEESKPSSPPVTAKQGNKKTDSESKNKTKNSSKVMSMWTHPHSAMYL